MLSWIGKGSCIVFAVIVAVPALGGGLVEVPREQVPYAVEFAWWLRAVAALEESGAYLARFPAACHRPIVDEAEKMQKLRNQRGFESAGDELRSLEAAYARLSTALERCGGVEHLGDAIAATAFTISTTWEQEDVDYFETLRGMDHLRPSPAE